ncbi:MAG: DMT family transporter [Leptospiraceae bacterium]|nr:DMT family transporter [Leptospiraceae bacterium]MCB1303185.1 DMT family transporter [Leptospiraceae bacterium]
MSQSIYRRRQIYGILLNAASALSFYFATFFVRVGTLSNPEIPSQAYAFVRYLTGFFFSIYLFRRAGLTFRLKVPNALYFRAIFNTLALLFFYESVASGNAATANVLNMTYPAFVALLAIPLLSEIPDRRMLLVLVFSLTGIGIYVLTPLIRSGTISHSDLWGLGSGLLAALAILALRGAAMQARAEEILLWMFGIGSIATLPIVLSDIPDLLSPSVIWVFLSALLGIAGQWLLTRSYEHLSATAGSIVSSLRIPIALIAGFFLLQEVPGLSGVLGAALIFAGNLFLALFRRAEKKE